MIALQNDRGIIAVDCGGDLVQKMLQAGLPLDQLEAIVLTHAHPDHVCSFPLVMQRLWLSGRRRSIRVIGPESALNVARTLMSVFQLGECDGMPRIDWQVVSRDCVGQPLGLDSWRVTVSYGEHSVESIAVRFEDPLTGSAAAYSSDTEPHENVIALARGTSILVHEATGSGPGHSSAEEAASVAARAEVGRLLLVHLPPSHAINGASLERARAVFPQTELGEEGGRYPL